MSLSDSQPAPSRVIYSPGEFGPVSPSQPLGLPGSSAHPSTRAAPFYPERSDDCSSRFFIASGRLQLIRQIGHLFWRNEADLGSLLLRLACSLPNASHFGLPRTAHGQLLAERYYKVNSFQFTG
jgi:hypothetical protein